MLNNPTPAISEQGADRKRPSGLTRFTTDDSIIYSSIPFAFLIAAIVFLVWLPIDYMLILQTPERGDPETRMVWVFILRIIAVAYAIALACAAKHDSGAVHRRRTVTAALGAIAYMSYAILTIMVLVGGLDTNYTVGLIYIQLCIPIFFRWQFRTTLLLNCQALLAFTMICYLYEREHLFSLDGAIWLLLVFVSTAFSCAAAYHLRPEWNRDGEDCKAESKLALNFATICIGSLVAVLLPVVGIVDSAILSTKKPIASEIRIVEVIGAGSEAREAIKIKNCSVFVAELREASIFCASEFVEGNRTAAETLLKIQFGSKKLTSLQPNDELWIYTRRRSDEIAYIDKRPSSFELLQRARAATVINVIYRQ